MTTFPTLPQDERWFADYANIVTLTAWLAENNYDADEVARAVEKPWNYEMEFLAAKYDLDEFDLMEVQEIFESTESDATLEDLIKARAAANADKESAASQHLFDQFKAGFEEGRPS
jgi:hypothetical protein